MLSHDRGIFVADRLVIDDVHLDCHLMRLRCSVVTSSRCANRSRKSNETMMNAAPSQSQSGRFYSSPPPLLPFETSTLYDVNKCTDGRRSQLEAIIRISESIAKVTLSPTVQIHHVEEAIRLFKQSTMHAVSAGSVDGMSNAELRGQIENIEKELKRRLPIGWSTSYSSLTREFVSGQGYSQHALEKCLYVLEKREVIRFGGQKKVVHRTGV